MYCRNCGKKIERGMLCQDCLTLLEQAKNEESLLAEQTITSVTGEATKSCVLAPSSASVKSADKEGENEKYISKKAGVFAVVLSVVGLFFQFALYVSLMDSLTSVSYVAQAEVFLVWIRILIFSTPAILSLILGILSITSFFKNKKNGKKTWANLILGGIAVELSSVSIFFLCVNLIMAIACCELLFIY